MNNKTKSEVTGKLQNSGKREWWWQWLS